MECIGYKTGSFIVPAGNKTSVCIECLGAGNESDNTSLLGTVAKYGESKERQVLANT